METKISKQIICLLILLNSFIHIACAVRRKENKNISLVYLFRKGYREKATYSIYMDGGFVGDSGSFVIDRLTGTVRKNEIDIGRSYSGSRYKNKIIREGSSVTQTENIRYFKSDSKSCVITDLNRFEDIQCTFKQRYERMAGPLILLSDDYFLLPLCISPFKDSWRNGLFVIRYLILIKTKPCLMESKRKPI